MLFRSEALSAQSAQSLGSVRIAAPRLGAWGMAAALALLAGLLTFFIHADATRRVRASGLLLPAQGLIELGLPNAARLVEVKVQEGQPVRAGDILALLHSDTQTPRGDALGLVERELALRGDNLAQDESNRTQQFELRRRALADRLRDLQGERERAAGEVDLARRRVELAQAQAERRQGLAREGFVSEAEVQARMDDWLDARQREAQSQRAHDALQRQIRAAESELADLQGELRAQLLQVRRSRSELDQQVSEQQARAVATLRAPADAVVAALNARPGQWVAAGFPVVSLLPAADGRAQPQLQAELMVPSHAAGFLAPDQSVKLRIDAYPYQKFGWVGGRIKSVSLAPAARLGSQTAPLRSGAESGFRVTVEMDRQGIAAGGTTHPLRAGMVVQAEMFQERRALWEWVLQPMLALRARAQGPGERAPAAPS